MTTRETERAIAEKVVDEALLLGLSVTVYDGHDYVLRESRDRAAILDAMFSAGEDTLFFRMDGERSGWVTLVYGNGWDVLADWSERAQYVLEEALKLRDHFIERHHERP